MMSPRVAWIFFMMSTLVHGQETFNTLPPPVTTTFSCKGRDTGFYADLETNCRVYHTCDDHGNKFTYHCPQDTAFQQDSLVCDHAYRVDCRKSSEFESQSPKESPAEIPAAKNSDIFSRSYRISPQPSVVLLAPKSGDKVPPTTFVMSSTMFFRGQLNSPNSGRQPKSEKLVEERNFVRTPNLTLTTSKPSFDQFQAKNSVRNTSARLIKNPVPEKPKNSLSEADSSGENVQNLGQSVSTSIKPFFVNYNNYPYIETLRSMQSNAEIKKNNLATTTIRTTTAGTEFPVPKFADALAGSNAEDPYYPRTSTTERYYSLSTKNKQQKFLAFTTSRPRINSAAFKIPETLPDLNSVEDIVDRRKLLFIPRGKNI